MRTLMANGTIVTADGSSAADILGRVVQGASDIVLSRGSVIVRNGAFTGRTGHGRYLKRAAADYVRLS